MLPPTVCSVAYTNNNDLARARFDSREAVVGRRGQWVATSLAADRTAVASASGSTRPLCTALHSGPLLSFLMVSFKAGRPSRAVEVKIKKIAFRDEHV
jgi:hypothetical protein